MLLNNIEEILKIFRISRKYKKSCIQDDLTFSDDPSPEDILSRMFKVSLRCFKEYRPCTAIIYDYRLFDDRI